MAFQSVFENISGQFGQPCTHLLVENNILELKPAVVATANGTSAMT